MPWKIDHFETDGDVTHITKVRWEEQGKTVSVHQLQTAIAIPPPGPERGPAVKAMRQFINALRHPPAPPDVTAIEDELNAGGE